jgi:hypothetical protein
VILSTLTILTFIYLTLKLLLVHSYLNVEIINAERST